MKLPWFKLEKKQELKVTVTKYYMPLHLPFLYGWVCCLRSHLTKSLLISMDFIVISVGFQIKIIYTQISSCIKVLNSEKSGVPIFHL